MVTARLIDTANSQLENANAEKDLPAVMNKYNYLVNKINHIRYSIPTFGSIYVIYISDCPIGNECYSWETCTGGTCSKFFHHLLIFLFFLGLIMIKLVHKKIVLFVDEISSCFACR